MVELGDYMKSNKLKYIKKIFIYIYLFFCFYIFTNNVNAYNGTTDPVTLSYNEENDPIVLKAGGFVGSGLWADCYDKDKNKKFIVFYGETCKEDKSDHIAKGATPVQFEIGASEMKSGSYRCVVKAKM